MAKDLINAVGKNCPNLQPDVRLLQEMLNRVAGLSVDSSKFDKLPLDGQISPLFVALLNKYQERSPAMMLEKDRVEPGSVTVAWLNSWDPQPPLTRSATLLCPHGGRVNVVTTGKANGMDDTLGRNAMLMVAGCPFFAPPLGPSPCMTAKFIATGSLINFVDNSAVGLCFNRMNVPQGNLIIATNGALMR